MGINKCLINQSIINREYARLQAEKAGKSWKFADQKERETWLEEAESKIKQEEFTDKQLGMSLDEFSQRYIEHHVEVGY